MLWLRIKGRSIPTSLLVGRLKTFADALQPAGSGGAVDAVHSKIGDRERAARELILAELAAARLGDQLPRAICYLMKREAVDIVACLGNPDPVGMKVYAPAGEETFDDIQTTEEAQAGADRREAA